MADEGEYELKDDGDMAEVHGSPGDGWGKGPRPGDPDFVPPAVVIESKPVAAKAAAPEPDSVDAAPPLEVADAEDVAKNKAMAILGYIFFPIPLLAAPQSRFARFHANQGLITMILWFAAVIGCVVCWAGNLLVHTLLANIAILVLFFGCLLYLLQPALLMGAMAMMLLGIVNAANGELKELPVVGTWRLLKSEPDKKVDP